VRKREGGRPAPRACMHAGVTAQVLLCLLDRLHAFACVRPTSLRDVGRSAAAALLSSVAPPAAVDRVALPRCLPVAASRGFGIVRFPSKDMADTAVNTMNNSTIGGRVVSVRIDRFA
jgi:hypothetical protein